MAVMTKEEFAQHVKSDTLPMYRLAYSILQNSADAEDAVSEAIVHAYEKLDTLKKQTVFVTGSCRLQPTRRKKSIGRTSAPVRWNGKRTCLRNSTMSIMSCGMR